MLNYLSRICFINAHVLLWTYFNLHLWQEVSVCLLPYSLFYQHHSLVGDKRIFGFLLTLRSISESSLLSGLWVHWFVSMALASLTRVLPSRTLILFSQELPQFRPLLVLAWAMSLPAQALVTIPGTSAGMGPLQEVPVPLPCYCLSHQCHILTEP